MEVAAGMARCAVRAGLRRNVRGESISTRDSVA
jgi:hypothetical protein